MGGKNSFFRKPLGKNSDASRAVSAITAPARAVVDAAEDISKGDLDSAKNRLIGGFGYMTSGGQFINASSSLRKAVGSTGFTDQFIQLDDYNRILMSGKNLNAGQIRGYAGAIGENLAYAGAAYAGASYLGSIPAQGSTFGSQGSYLGADLGAAPATDLGATGYLGANTGASAAGSSTSYLGASTSFTTKATGSSFFSSAAEKAGDYVSGYWKRVGQGAIDGVMTSAILGTLGAPPAPEVAPENSVYGYTDTGGSTSSPGGGSTSLFPLDFGTESGGGFGFLLSAGLAVLAFFIFRKFKN